jgi:hypothetical protein
MKSSILCLAIGLSAATACKGATPDLGPGERVATLIASADTTRDTGVVSWEIYRDAAQTTVVGIDENGAPAFRQHIAESIVDGKRTIDVSISQPAARSFRISDDGERIDLVVSDDPRLAKLVTHLQADSHDPEFTLDTEYGACLSCATNSTSCVASTAACATCPASGVGCLACPVMVTTCFAAGYYCACCYYGTTNC